MNVKKMSWKELEDLYSYYSWQYSEISDEFVLSTQDESKDPIGDMRNTASRLNMDEVFHIKFELIEEMNRRSSILATSDDVNEIAKIRLLNRT